MTSKAKQHALSRRTPAAHGSSRSTVRDRLWIFTVYAGGDHDHLEKGGIRGESRMTPAEGAFYLNVPNLLFIRAHDNPPLPYNQTVWRTMTEFDQYAISFRPLDRVIWSVVGSGGAGSLNELPYVLELAKKFPNIAGIFMDDFIIDAKKQANGRMIGKPVLQPSDLNKVHEQIKSTGKSMEVWVTLYTQEINPQRKTASLGYCGCEPPLTDFIDLFDVLTLWTWNSDELTELDENLVALEKIAPKKARIALGLYMWDYHNCKPVPVNLMKHQCELGLKWLQEGRIHEMIFLANTMLDLGLESAEFAREWIARVGNQPVQEKRTTGT
ncbi:MAG: hypothetical protein NT011_02245 [Kiritimatiellaeota bacterium]|nr:hypothetical protein [Kiritimatiellota bacterium]